MKRLVYFAVISLILSSCKSVTEISKTTPGIVDDWKVYTLGIDSVVKSGALPAQYRIKGSYDFIFSPVKDSLVVDEYGRVKRILPARDHWFVPSGTLVTFKEKGKLVTPKGNSIDVEWYIVSDSSGITIPYIPNGMNSLDEFSVCIFNASAAQAQSPGSQYGKTKLGDGFVYKYLLNSQQLMYSEFVERTGQVKNAEGSVVPGRKNYIEAPNPSVETKKKVRKGKKTEVPRPEIKGFSE